jgi:hypothetical protein
LTRTNRCRPTPHGRKLLSDHPATVHEDMAAAFTVNMSLQGDPAASVIDAAAARAVRMSGAQPGARRRLRTGFGGRASALGHDPVIAVEIMTTTRSVNVRNRDRDPDPAFFVETVTTGPGVNALHHGRSRCTSARRLVMMMIVRLRTKRTARRHKHNRQQCAHQQNSRLPHEGFLQSITLASGNPRCRPGQDDASGGRPRQRVRFSG